MSGVAVWGVCLQLCNDNILLLDHNEHLIGERCRTVDGERDSAAVAQLIAVSLHWPQAAACAAFAALRREISHI